MIPGLVGLWLAVWVPGGSPPLPGNNPGVLDLFSQEPWYRACPAEERTLEGVIELIPATGKLGPPGRHKTYRLAWNDPEGQRLERELYTPQQGQRLAVYLGRRVRVLGKTVDQPADGKIDKELWPGRLEALAPGSGDPAHGILARCDWPPAAWQRPGRHHQVITSAIDLARLMHQYGPGVAETASAQMARNLGVPIIDWNRQMLVCVCAGLHGNGERLVISRAVLTARTLTIAYRLVPSPDGASGICYPAQTALVDRFNGTVEVREDSKDPEPTQRLGQPAP